jgi:hypothetical protein
MAKGVAEAWMAQREAMKFPLRREGRAPQPESLVAAG